MCPEAQARSSSPQSATTPPTASVASRGRASNRKIAAHRKPSGTRQRCTHVPPLRKRAPLCCAAHARATFILRAPQTLVARREHARDFDVHADPLRARAPMTVRATTDVCALDADVLGARAAVTPPLGRAEQTDQART